MADLIRHRREAPAELGPMLRTAREHVGLRAAEVAFRTGISRPHLSNLEAGRRVPSETFARALADVLLLADVDRAWLLDVAVGDAGRDYPERG